jgi:hypothetical protein
MGLYVRLYRTESAVGKHASLQQQQLISESSESTSARPVIASYCENSLRAK